MAENRIRVRNPHKFNVGIVTMDKPYGVNIAPGSFTMLSKDEIDYLIGTSTLFTNGILRVEGDEAKQEIAEVLGIDMENNANFMSDEDIKKKLSMNANQLRKWLNSDGIQDFVLDRIAEIAKEMNLNANKLQVLKERLPEYEFI